MRRLWLLALTVFCNGCGGAAGLYEGCETNDDCDSMLYCKATTTPGVPAWCEDLAANNGQGTYCGADPNACPYGETCEGTTCKVSEGGFCESDSECADGGECKDSYCTGVNLGTCGTTGAACSAGQTCESGACVLKAGELCGFGVPCRSGYQCIQSTCQVPSQQPTTWTVTLTRFKAGVGLEGTDSWSEGTGDAAPEIQVTLTIDGTPAPTDPVGGYSGRFDLAFPGVVSSTSLTRVGIKAIDDDSPLSDDVVIDGSVDLSAATAGGEYPVETLAKDATGEPVLTLYFTVTAAN